MQYYSALKKNENLPFAKTWIDLEDIALSEMSDRGKQILYVITYMWNLKIQQTSEYNKKRNIHRYRDQASGYQRGKGTGRGKIGVED